jgi:alpha-amylase
MVAAAAGSGQNLLFIVKYCKIAPLVWKIHRPLCILRAIAVKTTTIMKKQFRLFTFFLPLLTCSSLVFGQLPGLLPSSVYEVNIRNYTDSGTFRAFLPHIYRIGGMGVSTLCYLPVFPVGEENRRGPDGNLYAAADYLKTDARYGTTEDFRQNVAVAHELGMKVIMDWVAPYTAFDHPWVKKHPAWYRKNADGSLMSPAAVPDVLCLDFSKKDMRKAMIEAMKFWIKETDIDGFRMSYTDSVAADFWKEAKAELSKSKKIIFIADSENTDLYSAGFDILSSTGLYELLHSMYMQEKAPATISDYVKLREGKPFNPSRLSYMAGYFQNYSSPERSFISGPASLNYMVLAYTLQGIPMMASGQELSDNTYTMLFDRAPLKSDEPLYYEPFRRFLEFRNQHLSILFSPKNFLEFIETGDENIVAYKWKNGDAQVLVVLNFLSHPKDLLLDPAWKGKYRDILSDQVHDIGENGLINLLPNQPLILVP